MAANSKIEWTEHTFNPWWGCEEISPACAHCYARAWAKRAGEANLWEGDRRRTGAHNWRQPLRWDRAAAAAGVRARVFCASMADVFDNAVPEQWRRDLFRLIGQTTNLDWLLLTKRIGNARRMLEDATAEHVGPGGWDREPWKNVWLGATVVTQEEADRDIPKLLAMPAARRFLSIEPMLGPIDLHRIVVPSWGGRGLHGSALQKQRDGNYYEFENTVDWVIVGGESGGAARPMHPQWPRDIRDQCASAGVPFHFKQWGEWRPPHVCEEFSTAKGRAQQRPAFIVSLDDGTVHCFYNEHVVYGMPVIRVGKHKAGRLLDGKTHDGFPS